MAECNIMVQKISKVIFVLLLAYKFSFPSDLNVPRISWDCSNLKDEQIYEGQTKVLSCLQLHTVPYNLTWLKSEQRLKKRDFGNQCEKLETFELLIKSEKLVGGGLPSTCDKYTGREIVMNNVTSADSGYYTCLVNNTYGCHHRTMKLDVIENGTDKYHYHVLGWNVTYTPWNETFNCPKMVVSYLTNFLVRVGDTLVLQFDKLNYFKEFICLVSNYDVTCLTNDISSEFTNEQNYALNLFLVKANGGKILVKSILQKIQYKDIRGSLSLFVGVASRRYAVVEWYRPWLTKCSANEYWKCFEEQFCIDKHICDTPTKIHIGPDSKVVCHPEDGRRTHERYICRRTIDDLRGNTNYTYRVRYSLDGIIGEDSWSTWSNFLNFNTLSELPAAPRFHCKGFKNHVLLIWRLDKSNDSTVVVDHFHVQANSKEYHVSAKNGQKNFEFKIPAVIEQYILLSACSSRDNSECSTSLEHRACSPDVSERNTILSFSLAGFLLCLCLLITAYFWYAKWRRRLSLSEDELMDPIMPRCASEAL